MSWISLQVDGRTLKFCKQSNLSRKALRLSFIPNTSELAFLGLAKQAQDHLDCQKADIFKALKANNGNAPKLSDAQLQELLTAKVRTEKVVHKDAKIRTFIQEDWYWKWFEHVWTNLDWAEGISRDRAAVYSPWAAHGSIMIWVQITVYDIFSECRATQSHKSSHDTRTRPASI